MFDDLPSSSISPRASMGIRQDFDGVILSLCYPPQAIKHHLAMIQQDFDGVTLSLCYSPQAIKYHLSRFIMVLEMVLDMVVGDGFNAVVGDGFNMVLEWF